jgi:hypothetical protein
LDRSPRICPVICVSVCGGVCLMKGMWAKATAAAARSVLMLLVSERGR